MEMVPVGIGFIHVYDESEIRNVKSLFTKRTQRRKKRSITPNAREY